MESPISSKSELKTFFGKCRCCLEYGYMKSMWSEYERDGLREIYGDMLMKTFSVTWQSSDNSQDYICETCVVRVQDAYDFKKVVLASEQVMYEDYDETEETTFKVDVTEDYEEINQENEPDDDFEEDEASASETEFYEVEYLEDEMETNAQETSDPRIKGKSLEEEKGKESEWSQKRSKQPYKKYSDEDLKQCLDAVKENRMTVWAASKFYGLPRKTVARYADLLNIKKQEKRDLGSTEKLVKDKIDKKKLSVSETDSEMAQIETASTLIKYSNLTPVRSQNIHGFPCFYCKCLFDNLDKLRKHTRQHNKNEVQKVLKTYKPESLIVYAEVTNLGCTICKMAIPNLNKLKIHLTREHNKNLLDNNDRVIPFKLVQKGYECQICAFSFETFGCIERHMNKHFRNYVCQDCGKGFVTKFRLRGHVKTMHLGGNFPCEICKKIFSTPQTHRSHVDTVHNSVKRFRCAKCPERFAEYFKRQQHMVEEHGCAPVSYRCNLCDKSFKRGYSLSRHMKRDHLGERDFQCHLCTYNSFSKERLKMHMVTHTGERKYECPVCKKSYPLKSTLTGHMKIHNNDKRYVCAVCGLAHVQKSSLVRHLKRHHPEYALE